MIKTKPIVATVYYTVLSCGSFYYALQGVSNVWTRLWIKSYRVSSSQIQYSFLINISYENKVNDLDFKMSL